MGHKLLPLAMEVFGCLHKQMNVFLHNCANVIWSLKRLDGPSLSILVTFPRQNISISLQKVQAYSILSQVILVGLATS